MLKYSVKEERADRRGGMGGGGGGGGGGNSDSKSAAVVMTVFKYNLGLGSVGAVRPQGGGCWHIREM